MSDSDHKTGPKKGATTGSPTKKASSTWSVSPRNPVASKTTSTKSSKQSQKLAAKPAAKAIKNAPTTKPRGPKKSTSKNTSARKIAANDTDSSDSDYKEEEAMEDVDELDDAESDGFSLDGDDDDDGEDDDDDDDDDAALHNNLPPVTEDDMAIVGIDDVIEPTPSQKVTMRRQSGELVSVDDKDEFVEWKPGGKGPTLSDAFVVERFGDKPNRGEYQASAAKLLSANGAYFKVTCLASVPESRSMNFYRAIGVRRDDGVCVFHVVLDDKVVHRHLGTNAERSRVTTKVSLAKGVLNATEKAIYGDWMVYSPTLARQTIEKSAKVSAKSGVKAAVKPTLPNFPISANDDLGNVVKCEPKPPRKDKRPRPKTDDMPSTQQPPPLKRSRKIAPCTGTTVHDGPVAMTVSETEGSSVDTVVQAPQTTLATARAVTLTVPTVAGAMTITINVSV